MREPIQARVVRLPWPVLTSGEAGAPARGRRGTRRRRRAGMAGLDTTTTTAPGREGAGPHPTPGHDPMELDDATAREMQRGIEDIGTRTRADSLEQKKYTDAMADGVRDEWRRELRARMDGLEHKQARELESVECAMRRGGMTGETSQDGTKVMVDRSAPEIKALETYLRRGKNALDPSEYKALSVGN